MARAGFGYAFARVSRLRKHEADLFYADLMGLASARGRRPTEEADGEAWAESGPLIKGPLTESEWGTVIRILTRREAQVGSPLTANADTNALLVAARIFCDRNALRLEGEDPLLCLIDDVTTRDRRVRALVPHVIARGPIVDWTRHSRRARIVYVMRLLTGPTYGYSVNAAAGIVGSLIEESSVLPQNVESSWEVGNSEETPMRAKDFAGRVVDFTAEEIMNRNEAARRGPVTAGIGLAQWTTTARRAGLFTHTFRGVQLGPRVLFDMDAQVDYLVTELRSPAYAPVQRVLTHPSVTIDRASDSMLLDFENPGQVRAGGAKRTAVINRRRGLAQWAAAAYNAAATASHP